MKLATEETLFTDQDEISKNNEKIQADADKMAWAVQQLTLDTLNKVDHKKELEEVAKLMNITIPSTKFSGHLHC